MVWGEVVIETTAMLFLSISATEPFPVGVKHSFPYFRMSHIFKGKARRGSIITMYIEINLTWDAVQ